HELAVRLPPEPAYVEADPIRLAQVVGNLINNASKFTDEGGHIVLSLEHDDGQAVIRVRDDGIGIRRDQIPRLFDLFMQVDTSLDRSGDGLGLALPVGKNLLEMHGGSGEAPSEGLACGSGFVVRLPALADVLPAVASPTDGAPAVAAHRHVLIVDDNED